MKILVAAGLCAGVVFWSTPWASGGDYGREAHRYVLQIDRAPYQLRPEFGGGAQGSASVGASAPSPAARRADPVLPLEGEYRQRLADLDRERQAQLRQRSSLDLRERELEAERRRLELLRDEVRLRRWVGFGDQDRHWGRGIPFFRD